MIVSPAQADEIQHVKLGYSDGKIRELIAQREYLRAANLISRKSDGALLVKGHLLLRADRARDAVIIFDGIKKPPKDLADFYFCEKRPHTCMLNDLKKPSKPCKKSRDPNCLAALRQW